MLILDPRCKALEEMYLQTRAPGEVRPIVRNGEQPLPLIEVPVELPPSQASFTVNVDIGRRNRQVTHGVGRESLGVRMAYTLKRPGRGAPQRNQRTDASQRSQPRRRRLGISSQSLSR